MKPGGDPFSIKNFLLSETNITAHLYLAAHPLYTMSYRQYILGKVTVMIFLQILWNDILPLIVFLAAGWFMDSKFKLDLNTYAKLVTRVVLPAFIFTACICTVPMRRQQFFFQPASRSSSPTARQPILSQRHWDLRVTRKTHSVLFLHFPMRGRSASPSSS